MIEPDDKDWTWVLAERCPDCGFDAATCAATDVADLIRANAAEWRTLAEAGRIQPGRPDEQTWSSLEYACHVRDVYRRFDRRMALMQAEDDPLFENWDQDATAIEDRYEEQDPDTVVADLEVGAAAIADRLDAIEGDEWQRPGRRSDGNAFTLDTLARYLIHDPVHHIWDVTR